jgi:aminopeptidase N
MILVLLLVAQALTVGLPAFPAIAQASPLTEGAASIGDPYAPELGNTGYDVQHYDLNLSFNFDDDSLRGVATLTARTTLANLTRFSLDFATLHADSVTVNDQKVTFEQRDADQKLSITLPSALPAGTVFTTVIAYSGQPTPFNSRYLHFLPIGMYMDGKARTVFAVNQPDAAHTWFPCNDHPRDRASYAFTITVPVDLSAVANGQQQGAPVDNGDGTHTFRWQLKSEMSSYLATVAVANYVRIPLPSTAGGIPLAVYAYDGQQAGAQHAFGETDALMKLLSSYFGPYPFDTYGQVLVPQDSVGLEAQTMTIVPDSFSRADPDRIYTFIAHEMAHQWFGDAVSVDTWRDIWLNEGFASYTEYLVLESTRGLPAARRLLNLWENSARIVTGIAPVTNPPQADMFGTNTYLKGGFALHMLRLKLGDTAFFKVLQTYFKRFAGKTATTADFEKVAAEVSGMDLSAFFSTWLERSEIPTARIAWLQQDGQVNALVCQLTKTPFKVTIPLVLSGSGADPKKQDAETLTLDQPEMRLTFKPGFEVLNWQIDPENRILATVNVNEVQTLPAHCAS